MASSTISAVDKSTPVFSDSIAAIVDEDALTHADRTSGMRGAVTGMLLGAALWCGILLLAGVFKV